MWNLVIVVLITCDSLACKIGQNEAKDCLMAYSFTPVFLKLYKHRITESYRLEEASGDYKYRSYWSRLLRDLSLGLLSVCGDASTSLDSSLFDMLTTSSQG